VQLRKHYNHALKSIHMSYNDDQGHCCLFLLQYICIHFMTTSQHMWGAMHHGPVLVGEGLQPNASFTS
ncbi:hypothetical protein ACJX0J_030893, partial [Zea mays]